MKSHLLLYFLLIFSTYSIAQFSTEHLVAITIPEITAMDSGDLDGDGDEDLAFVSNDANMVAWLKNLDGEGTMSLPIVLDETFYKADAIRLTDLNGDGHLDIVAISRGEITNSQIAWYPNEGDGIFDTKQIIHQQSFTSVSNEWFLEIMDINADGDLDLMVGLHDDPALLMWFENFDGLGNFLPPTTIFSIDSFSNVSIENMTLGDMDNDEDLDVVMIRRFINTDSLFWFENNNENFSESHFFHTTSSQQTGEIEVLDADGDGDLDVVTMADFSDRFQFFENLGGGNMASPTAILNNGGIDPQTFCVADIDADEDLDIAFYDNTDNLMTFENLDDDFFGNIQFYEILSGEIASSDNIYAADLNGDGASEILPIEDFGDKMLVHRNDGFGNLSESEILTGNLDNYNQVRVADFDNNGFPDITGELFQYSLVWYKNVGTQFLNPQHITSDIDSPFDNLIIDLNADGAMDLVTISNDFDNKRLVSLLNDGNGKFPISTTLVTTSNDDGFLNLASEDIDNDGDKDLIFVKLSGTYWMENTDGIGTFGAANLLTEIRAQKYIWNDFDGDGDNDFYLDQTLDENIYFLENTTGNGVFSPAQSVLTLDVTLDNLSAGDFDADGDLDLVIVFSGEREIEIFYNNNQNFSQSEIIFEGSFANSIGELLPFDVDYDGLPDLVYDFDDGLVWQKNLGNGLFSDQIIITDTNFFSDITFYDMDADGDEDLVASGHKRVSWFENIALNPTISAFNFYDNNEDGIKDADDFLLFNNSIFLSPNGLYTFPNDEGLYQFAVNNGSYNLSVNDLNEWMLTTDSLSVSVEVMDTSVNKSFGWKPLIEVAAIETNLTSGSPRCDQEVPFWLGYTNTGTITSDALIQLEADDLVTYISATPAPDSIVDNVYYWTINDVLPTHSGSIQLIFGMPDANSTGVITTFPYQTTIADANPIFQQNDTLFNEIRCAYDPNDKMVVPDRGEPLHPIGLNERLEYTVRFQNTGNDTAYHVFIKDQLDENLNWATLTPLQSSHPMDMTLDEEGLVTFRFLNIYLPDSLSNPAGSQGFVKYQIDLKTGLTEGLVIENTAHIIFDSNPAIITNTTQNTLSSEFTNNSNGDINPILVEYAPNPFSDFITFKITGQVPLPEMTFELYDGQGKRIDSEFIGNNYIYTYYPKGLVTGIYFIQIKDKNTGRIISKQKIIYVP